ncbi:uncharacterized protein Tco025E_04069 [Trypanosoma conorhini]|uniref:Uncharacterized protein n=1 Tax=Trypanosoma conorhini TaxID=83891 RepID=A0A3R7P9K5_9TRYP|nr:uncharacterized protein Tco025E_04069 [Trypanosoma conorhini]RNF19830.1 hypothetical protein Tco025E_04069 [Trypanosoma conorhini]
MPGPRPRQHSRAALAFSLQDTCRETDLLLLARYFHKVRQYVHLQRQNTHLKRCAVLLRHQATRRTVMDYFIRWLGTTQRQTSVRSGQREPKKIVVLPRAQDFINLGRRYLARWRLWLRHQRQRRHQNVALLHNKVAEARQQEIFFRWFYFISQKQRKALESRISELECDNKRQTWQVTQLEAELRQRQSTIMKLKEDAEKLQMQNTEQEKKLTDIKAAAETAIKRLAGTTAKVTDETVTSATREVAQHEDEFILRLLKDCTDAGKALEKLRVSLPEDAVPSTSFQSVAEIACQRSTEMEDTVARLKKALHDTKSVAVFFCRLLQEGGSRVLELAKLMSLADPPSAVDNLDEMRWPLLRWGPQSDLAALEESLGGTENLKLVQDHLLQRHRLAADGPSTASVLESFREALGQMQEALSRCRSHFLEQKMLAGQEAEKKVALAKAVRDAVAALRGWSVAPADVAPEGMKEQQLATEVLRESEAASKTLKNLRQLLTRQRVGETPVVADSLGDWCRGTPYILQLPVIETHDELVNAVSKVCNRLSEVSKAYNEVYSEFLQFVPDSPRPGREVNGNVVFFAPPTGRRYDPVKRAEVVVSSVTRYIQGKGREVKELRGVMRRGIEALGGTEESDTDDDVMDQERSAANSARVGKALALLCRDTGDAINDARAVLGVPKEGKLTLSQVIPNLREKMRELEAVTTESAALMDEVRLSLASAPRDGSLTFSRRLKPKRKPMALVVNTAKAEKSEAMKLLHISATSTVTRSVSLKPVEILRGLRREIADKTAEVRQVREACQTLIGILDGSHVTEAEQSQRGELLLPLLAAQAEELRRGLRLADAALSDAGVRGGSSVGNYLAVLASNVMSLRAGKETLQEEVNQRIKQANYLMTELTEHTIRLKTQNKILHKTLNSLQEKFVVQKHVRQIRAEQMKEILRLRTVKELLRRRLLAWLGRVVAMRSTEARGAVKEQKRLSFEVVQKQHQQNQLAKLLATALDSLPGEAARETDAFDTEHTLLQRALECEGAALEAFVRERLDAAKAWMQSFAPVLSAVASLRAEAVALRQLVAAAWGGGVERAYRQILFDALKGLATSGEEKERESAFLRNRARDREEIARANTDLAHEVAELREALEGAQVYIVSQDEQIIKLRRENRDLQINSVICRDDSASNTFNGPTPSSNLRAYPEAECLMLARSKRLLLEAIKAMAGEDLAACIGEVAELTLKLYRRTTTALEEICSARDATLGPLPAQIEAWLQELQCMRGARNAILARLPMLLRMPYAN